MAAVDANSDARSLGGIPPPDVVGGDVAGFSEVDNWLGSTSFVVPQPSQPQSQTSQMSVNFRSMRYRLVAHLDSDYNPVCAQCESKLIDDPKWEIWFHFLARESVVRRIYQSDISYITLVSLIASEGRGADDYMYYVVDEKKGIEGLEHVGCEDDVQQMLIQLDKEKIVNIRVARADEPSNADENRDSYFAEHGISTQQSCTKLVDATKERKEELKNNNLQREADLNHFEGDTDVSEFLSDEDGNNVELHTGSSSEEEAAKQNRSMVQKLKAVRNPGPTSRSHHEVEKKEKPDWFPKADEFCFPGDPGISDEEDEIEGAFKLPSGRKRRLKKMKERVWFNEKLPDPQEQFCKGLCFTNVYVFRDALRDFHIRTLRNFQYQRNAPDRIIVWCSERAHGCDFYICASKIAREQTFCIKKCDMLHTCGACAENTKVTTKWLSKSVQPALRDDIRAPVDALIKKTKTKFSVDVSRSVAYRARRKAVDVVQGDHKQQYLRLRDYLQAFLDTNPGSRCIVTTFVDPENPAPTPRFKYMFYCLAASKEGFLNGCRPFIGLDGCFIKLTTGQQILAATGRDGES
ncbi:uncharacterized protein [Aegilops tauschii subsp. strangulata]|uniref:uncharacterized protein n=1 Tax=Aegilops tauschii subsp. strangulata TaxID=200361 RepID=UPI003CC8C6D9